MVLGGMKNKNPYTPTVDTEGLMVIDQHENLIPLDEALVVTKDRPWRDDEGKTYACPDHAFHNSVHHLIKRIRRDEMVLWGYWLQVNGRFHYRYFTDEASAQRDLEWEISRWEA